MMEVEQEDRLFIQARFSTTQEQYAIPDNPLLLSSHSTPKDLNVLISGVLNSDLPDKNKDNQTQFDFLIDGELLRTSIEEYLEEKIISTEKILEIEYVECRVAPSPFLSLSHDDWVSCVHATSQLIVCGCYDNTLRLWSTEGKCLMTIPGHSGPVKCVSWIKSSESKDAHFFVSGSHDQTMYVWKLNIDTKQVDCVAACRGHSGSVDCTSVNEDGQRIITGSWDKTVKLWMPNKVVENELESEVEERATKKLKSGGPKLLTVVPLLTLSGHREAVSSVIWLDNKSVCSASWDHTLRVWDMSSSQQTNLIEGSKAFFSIAHNPSNNLIVSASADRHVRMHDLRTQDFAGTFTSHTGWISCVDWCDNSEHLFLSGSHDTLVKLWDMRSPKAPLYNLIGHEDKVLTVDCSVANLMISGGADKELKIFKNEQLN